MNAEQQALERIHKRGGHLVLCHPDKRPLHKNWQHKPPALEAVLNHSGPVGIIPASIGAVVVDVDKGPHSTVIGALMAEPFAIVPTRREGGKHLWFRSDESLGNKQWSIGDAAGDVRSAKGFAILWDPVAVADGLETVNGATVDLKPLLQGRKSPSGVDAVRTAPEGTRNDTLNREAFTAVADGEYDRAAYEQAAREAGLTEQETAATLDSAEKAGKEKAKAGDHLNFARAYAIEYDGGRKYRHARGMWMQWTPNGWVEVTSPLLDMAKVIEKSADPKVKKTVSTSPTHIGVTRYCRRTVKA